MSHYKPYPAYRDSGVEWIGQVPEHWDVKRLKYSVASCKNGVWGDDPVGNATEDIPCVRVADFDRDKLRVVLNDPTMRKVKDSERQGRILKYGDLLLEKSGGGEKQPVGCVVQYEDEHPAVCSNFIARIEVAPEHSSSFVRNVHHALYCARITTNSINQTSGIQNLDQERYLNEFAAFPAMAEQKLIVSLVDRETTRIDALITKKTRFIELLKEKRQALITHAVTKGLDPNVPMKDSGVEWIGKVPAHWNVVQSRRLFEERRERAREGDVQFTASQKYDVIPQTEFMEKEGRRVMLVGKGQDILKHIEPGDFLISMRSFEGGLEECRGSGSVSSAYVPLIPVKWVWNPFFKYLFKSNGYIQALQSTSDLVRDGQALRFENFSKVSLLEIPIDEQKQISVALDRETARIDLLADKTQRSINLLKERRAAFITAAVTGQIDLRESA